MFSIDLPWPPSVNHYYRHVGPRVLISKEGRVYQKLVKEILARHGVQRMACEVEVTLDVFPPDRRRRDIDNVQKALLDALQKGGAYEDDYQIRKLTTERWEVVENGRVTVMVKEAGRRNAEV